MLEYLGFLFNVSFQEGIKTALCQHNGSSETVKVHTGFFFNEPTHKALLGLNELSCNIVRNLVFLILQVAFSLFPCPALFPVTAESAGLGFKQHLCIAFTSLAGHNLISALGDFSKAGCGSIECQTDGIKNGRLARTGWTGQGKDSIGYIFGVGKIYDPFAIEGVEVLKSQFKYLHNQPLYSAFTSSSWRDLIISL